MNPDQKEVIQQLLVLAKSLNKTPGRRDVPYSTYQKCLSYFGSFNHAKECAGLKIFTRVRKPLFPQAYTIDLDLVRIASFITFDGHLYKSLRGFMIASRNLVILNDFARVISKKFGLIGSFREKNNHYGMCYTYFFFNSDIAEFFYHLGIPRGDKMITRFKVPFWIQRNKQFAKEYLKIAFYCEGNKHWKNKKESIQFNLNKSEELLSDGLRFMTSLKKLLRLFNIETTEVWLADGNIRKRDGKRTQTMRFKLKMNSVHKFIKTIGWLK